MHTFLSGPEFCFMVRKLFSSCRTSKNFTLNEQYPDLCKLLQMFPNLCGKADYALENSDEDDEENINFTASKERQDVMQMLLTTRNTTIKPSGLR